MQILEGKGVTAAGGFAASGVRAGIKPGSEKNDLAGTMPEKAAALRGKLEQWRKEVGAATPKPNSNYDPKRAGTWGPRSRGANVP